VGLAARTLRRYEDFLGTTLAEKIRNASPDSLRGKLDSADVTTLHALGAYRQYLTDTLLAAGGSSWATGTKYYDWLLKEVQFLPYSSDSMIALGWKMHNETKKLLEEFARKTDPGKTWKELVEEMKSHHPEPHRIADEYRSESDRVLKLLRDGKLVAIPPAETLIFVPTPLPLRETYAWGGYGGTTMKEGRSTGRFFVTDVTPDMSPEKVEEKLRTQNTGWITVIALHEGYPGHHLQQVYAEKNPRKIREQLGSTYYAEGWALYCESWMARNGYYLDRWDSLGWLQMRLWRTARVIIDPSIHTGKMTYDEAVKFFVEEVGLERSAAEAEVNRYTTWPTQAPSYIIGWREIENLKTEMQRLEGDRFSERRFAEAILGTGSLPLELMKRAVRAEMQGTGIQANLRKSP
jgi:uncharacterized protein (DUF885 family)